MRMKFCEASIPSYAVSYIEYGDSSGLNDEDIANIDKFLESLNDYFEGYRFSHVDWFCNGDDPSFTSCPAFGLPCDCYEAKIVFTKV